MLSISSVSSFSISYQTVVIRSGVSKLGGVYSILYRFTIVSTFCSLFSID